MDSCIKCDELLEFDNLTFDDFTRYPNMCPDCCVETDLAIAEQRVQYYGQLWLYANGGLVERVDRY